MGNAMEASYDKGPFTDQEYTLIVQTYNNHKSKDGTLHVDCFVEIFDGCGDPDFFRSLFKVFKSQPLPEPEEHPITDSEIMCFKEFFNGVSNTTRASDRSIMRIIYQSLDTEGKNQLPYSKLKDFFRLAYKLHCLSTGQCCTEEDLDPSSASSPPFRDSLYAHPIPQPDGQPPLTEDGLSSLASKMGNVTIDASSSSNEQQQQQQEKEEQVTFEDFYGWMSQNVPLLYQCFAAFVYTRICPGLPVPSSLQFLLPFLREKSSIIKSPDQVFGLALASPALEGAWERLYTSEENGLSFNRICHHILGYRGPTALLCKDTQGHVFGFYTSETWKESNSYYGSSECFLFRVEPNFVIARPKFNSNHHYMYLNLKGYSLPHGIGVGGNTDNFRFFIPESLEGCISAAADTTFEYGQLASRKEFDLIALEVWGVGGEDRIKVATDAQGLSRQTVADNIAKARKVDKSKFIENDFDREMFFGKTFGQGAKQAGLRSDR